jgi:hypothetical protein
VYKVQQRKVSPTKGEPVYYAAKKLFYKNDDQK